MDSAAYQKKLFITACFFLLTGVALGAFAAHGLQKTLDASALRVFQTGVQYQMYHGLGLLAIASQTCCHGRALRWGALLLIFGVILFSGSLYALSLMHLPAFGIITPFGGAAFILGWLLLAFSVRTPSQE